MVRWIGLVRGRRDEAEATARRTNVGSRCMMGVSSMALVRSKS